jgi:hypothetical protein
MQTLALHPSLHSITVVMTMALAQDQGFASHISFPNTRATISSDNLTVHIVNLAFASPQVQTVGIRKSSFSKGDSRARSWLYPA